MRQNYINHHLWKNLEGITSCYLKFISRAKKCHKKIAQDFLSCTYANIHTLIFLPLLDIYFVHIHDMVLPSLLERGNMEPNKLTIYVPNLQFLHIFPFMISVYIYTQRKRPVKLSTNYPKSFKTIFFAILFFLDKQREQKLCV